MSRCVLLLLILTSLEEYKSVLLRGKRARDGQFPWLIQFQTIAPCGGILVSPDWVLTAAQCVQDKRNSIVLFAGGLNGTGSRQTVYVKATYIFPRYEAYSTQRDRDNNIALLKLTQPYDMCNVKVTLPEVAPVKLDDNYKSCLIFGWQSYISPSSKVLAKPIQYSEVILNSWKLCTYMIKGNASYANVFCTMVEFEDDMKACAGNPGSPVVCENQYKKLVLLGIASWTNFSLDCGDLPTYLDVSAFRTWMYDLIHNDKKREDWEVESSSNRSRCKYMENLGHVDAENNAWNYTRFYPMHSQEHYLSDGKGYNSGTPVVIEEHKNLRKGSNVPNLRNKLYPPVVSSDDYINTPYRDTIKERSKQRYQEIGKTKDIPNHEDEIMASSDEQQNLDYESNKISLHKNKFDEASNELSDDADFEFMFPLNFDDATSSSNTTEYSQNLVFSFFIFLYLFYRALYW